MKYELEVYSNNSIGIRKIMIIPLWSSNISFDTVETLNKYITDYLELNSSLDEVTNLVKSAAMNVWVKFG